MREDLEPMGIEELRAAIEEKKIDRIIGLTGGIEKEEAAEAILMCEAYLEKETAIAQSVQDILAHTRMQRRREKIAATGSRTYQLEE